MRRETKQASEQTRTQNLKIRRAANFAPQCSPNPQIRSRISKSQILDFRYIRNTKISSGGEEEEEEEEDRENYSASNLQPEWCLRVVGHKLSFSLASLRALQSRQQQTKLLPIKLTHKQQQPTTTTTEEGDVDRDQGSRAPTESKPDRFRRAEARDEAAQREQQLGCL